LRSDPAESVEAPAVFVGYGLTVPEAKYDDLEGLDLRGKIAVFVPGGPPSIPGALRAHYESAGERWKFLQRAGVIGIVSIANPRTMDIPWERQSLARLQPSMSIADRAMDETAGLKLSVAANP